MTKGIHRVLVKRFKVPSDIVFAPSASGSRAISEYSRRSVICEVPMTTIDDNIINQMTECIVKEVNPVRIILFGSSARGHTHEGSDVDLLVIEDAPFGEGRSRFRETGRINRALAGFSVAKDILVYSIDEVERWRNTLNHVISHALREGRDLYVRP